MLTRRGGRQLPPALLAVVQQLPGYLVHQHSADPCGGACGLFLRSPFKQLVYLTTGNSHLALPGCTATYTLVWCHHDG